MPVKLEYDPLESAANMHRFLADLLRWTLEGKVWHRQATACRGIIETCLKVQGAEEIEGKLDQINAELAAAKNLHQQMEDQRESKVIDFIISLPEELRKQVTEYVTQQIQLEEAKVH